MQNVVKTLCKAIEGEKLVEMTRVLDDFERQMDNVAVQSSCLNSTLQNTAALVTPPEQVTNLLQQVADEHGLAISQSLAPTPNNEPFDYNKYLLDEERQKELSQRLSNLRNN